MDKKLIILLGLLYSVVFLSAFWGSNTDYAVYGYDPVAYFTQSKAAKGKHSILYQWEGKSYVFSSEEHRALFKKNPAKYVPRYEGYCAYGMAQAAKVESDPDAWSIVDGVLYLNVNKSIRARWLKDTPRYIRDADRSWEIFRKK